MAKFVLASLNVVVIFSCALHSIYTETPGGITWFHISKRRLKLI